MPARFPVTVHLLFFRDDKILLSRRFKTGYRDGEYSLPAGHVDAGETVRAAAAREAEEEVGVRLRLDDVRFSGVMNRSEESESVDFFFHVHNWQGEPVNKEPHQCDDLRWVDLQSLPDNMVPYVRRAIQNHLQGMHFDEFGWAGSE